jgi:hypothetical protein
LRSHPRIAGFVFLFTFRSVVGRAVEFDDELGLDAVEVGGVRAEGVLAAKLQSAELAVAEELPEIVFRNW